MNKKKSILYDIKNFWELKQDYRPKAGIYFYYAAFVLHKRIPAAEPVIAKNPHFAYYYARDVLKKRFPAGEPAIAKKAIYASWYASDVLNDRFPAGEKTIFNSVYKDNYELSVLRKLGLTWRDLGYE